MAASTGAVLAGCKTTSTTPVTLSEGTPLSLAMTRRRLVAPPWLGVVGQVSRPVAGSTIAPLGAPGPSRKASVSCGSGSLAVTSSESVWPAMSVTRAGTVRVGDELVRLTVVRAWACSGGISRLPALSVATV